MGRYGDDMGIIWPRYGKWKISGKLVAKHWHRHGFKTQKNEIAVNNPNLTVETYLTYA